MRFRDVIMLAFAFLGMVCAATGEYRVGMTAFAVLHVIRSTEDLTEFYRNKSLNEKSRVQTP